MSDFKAVKRSNRERLEGDLEVYEKHADDLALRREHSDRMYEFMESQVEDIADLERIRTAKENADICFREAFREQVEIPTNEIKEELDKDSDELFAESRNVMGAVEIVEGHGVSDNVVSQLKSELGKSANEYQKMAQEARDTIARSDEKVNSSRLRVYGMYK